jgi:P27 family predicted phage terminase small subunit
MKGAKPKVSNVVPMRGDALGHVPEAPDWMSHEGREVWERLAPIMVARKRLEPHFEDTFAAYCESVAAFIRCTGDVAIMGSYYSVKTRNGMQEKHRAVFTQQQAALSNMQRLSSLFGMSPVDESRLKIGGQGDLFDEILAKLDGGH